MKKLGGVEESQLINYLKATSIETGLLLNFRAQSLEYKRFVHSKTARSSRSQPVRSAKRPGRCVRIRCEEVA